jgi:hypothetical protein
VRLQKASHSSAHEQPKGHRYHRNRGEVRRELEGILPTQLASVRTKSDRQRIAHQNPQVAPINKDSPRMMVRPIVTSDSIKPSEGSVSRRCEGARFACFTPRSEK